MRKAAVVLGGGRCRGVGGRLAGWLAGGSEAGEPAAGARGSSGRGA